MMEIKKNRKDKLNQKKTHILKERKAKNIHKIEQIEHKSKK